MIVEKKGREYTAYVEQQGRKANNPVKSKQLLNGIPKRIRKFEKIFGWAKESLHPGAVLCLGARTGCEVKAARNIGFVGSMGIDLHPLGNTDGVVVQGDWHNIPFPNESFENVYTNSIDHCFDMEKMAVEIHRVLKDHGRYLMMLSGTQMLTEKDDPEDYMLHSQNFLFWENGLDLARKFEEFGFKLISNWKKGNRWHYYVLEKQEV